MNVCMISSFRDAHRTIATFVNQAAGLAHLLARFGSALTCLWGDGDSGDDTPERLAEAAKRHPALNARIVDVAHGGPKFGSVVDARRFAQLAHVGNTLLAHVPPSADVLLFVESDLIWRPQTLLALLAHMGSFDCIAPMTMHIDNGPHRGRGPFFYDTFAYRAQGRQFTNAPPYHAGLMGVPMHMESVGSCVALDARWLPAAHFPPDDVFVGFCRGLRAADCSIWLDPSITVYHP